MKFAIDLGHGIGQDRGAVGVISEESVINDVGNKVISMLKDQGHQVLSVRPTQAGTVTDSLTQRVNASNEFEPDLYVSIHANAGGGHGSEVYTYKGKELTQARQVLNNLVSLGFTNRGIKEESLFVINRTRANAMLVEICFIDTESDVNLYNKLGAGKIASAIVAGVTGNSEISSTPEPQNSAPVTETTTQSVNISSNLRNWQSAYNRATGQSIAVDGLDGPETQNAINNSMISQGARNSLVAWVQSRIGASPDAVFGPRTKAAVISYQETHGLVPDGIVGPKTFRSLLNSFNW